jgi:preprotein translocase subunit YajC
VNLLSLAPALLAATTKKSTTSSGSYTFLIFIVIVVVALYFLFLRPNQQKAKRAREENATIGVGDRVVTIGGIVGVIEEMHGDRVLLVSSNPGFDGAAEEPTRLIMLRSAIARKVDVAPPAQPEAASEAGQNGATEHETEESGTAEGAQE